MKVLFENITEYNKNEISKFQEFNIKKSKPYAIYVFFLSVLFICFTILNIIEGNWKWILNVGILAGLLIYYFKFFKPKNDKKHNFKLINKRFKFDFYGRYINCTDINIKNDKSSIVNYFEVKKVYETEGNFYLYLCENDAIIINKNNFTIGKLPEFRKFIKSKCFLKYRKNYKLNKTKKIINKSTRKRNMEKTREIKRK